MDNAEQNAREIGDEIYDLMEKVCSKVDKEIEIFVEVEI